MSLDTLVKTITSGFTEIRLWDFLDIAIIAFFLYKLIVFTKETRAFQLLKGVAVLFVAAFISDLLQLPTLSWVLNSVLASGILVIVVLFQPEIRKTLEHIGRGKLFVNGIIQAFRPEDNEIVNEMQLAIMNLARRHVGALIVIEQRTGLGEIISTGTKINGTISAPLLENIFEPNTPLHDGAVVMRKAWPAQESSAHATGLRWVFRPCPTASLSWYRKRPASSPLPVTASSCVM